MSSNTKEKPKKSLTKLLATEIKQYDQTKYIPIIITELLFKQLVNEEITLQELLEETTWKDVSDKSNYQISPIGILRRAVYTLPDGKNIYHYTSGSLNNSSSLRVTIPGEKMTLVHDIVAKLFLNQGVDFSSHLVVDHIDTNTVNNRVTNLKIVTQKDNMNNPTTKKKKSKSIICTFNNGNIMTFDSFAQCADYLKVSKSLVTRWINRGWFSKNTGIINFNLLEENGA